MNATNHHNRFPQRRSLRLAHYDYASPGHYFVTLCTHDRACLFGRIENGKMHASAFGRIIEAYWHALPEHHENLALDSFVVMPNHIHGILILTNEKSPSPVRITPDLSQIIGAFKSFSARRINILRHKSGVPVWQRGYYEYIIRHDDPLGRIRKYIEANPARWALDRENPANIHRPQTTGGSRTRPYKQGDAVRAPGAL